MRRTFPALLLVLVLLALHSGAPPAGAAEPPNQNDPCSSAGRDTCGTTGIGAYKRYRYGVRWFGSYRGAIPGVTLPAWCIDLRFWYPSTAFAYEQHSAVGLRSKEGKTLSAAELRQMSWAIWNHGRGKAAGEQGAVMLYVHSLMGDGAPGEVDPKAIGVKARFDRIARDARAYAGPYRIEAKAPKQATAGTKVNVTVRVIAASGRAVPGVRVDLQGSAGAAGLPASVRTSSKGSATVAATPNDVKGGLRLQLRTEELAATAPDLYVPTKGASKRSAQRLVVPASTTVAAATSTTVVPAKLTVTTAATPGAILLGESNRDTVTIGGAPPGWKGTVTVRAYGPARTPEELRCDVPPVAQVSYTAGAGASPAPPITPGAAGWYGYQVTVDSTPEVIGQTTPCAVPEERFRVEVQPAVRTEVSSLVADPGVALSDTAWVTGLSGEPAVVGAKLYGPYPTRAAMTCTDTPAWQGSIDVPGDGEYRTDPVTLTVPGYYTYREDIAAQGFVRAFQAPCGETTETSIVRGTPAIHTQISSQDTAVGTEVTDTAVVSGLGKLTAPVAVELWGPYPTKEAITCEGTPFWKGSFDATGDGSYVTAPVKLAQAGYYTYREAILPGEGYAGVQTGCGEATETTIARATPKVVTKVSSPVVRPGSSIFDRLEVTGLGTTPASVEVELFGPFRTRAAIRCSGTPFWKGNVAVKGDGTYTTPKVTVPKAGFYTYRERIASSGVSAGTQTACAEEAETALAQPLIPTGGEPVASTNVDATKGDGGSRPTSVRLDRLNVRATITPVSIDADQGVLHVPNDIQRAGWWADGASPGAKTGATLIAGHVDSAKKGAGAFFRLVGAKRGDRIEVRTADGKTRSYRVTGVRRVLKSKLPSSIFSRTGSPRLELVTCGGPFANGHYRDNIIVSAAPR
ncbi:class F sortase [Patulibacter sp. NPDC049589]|uniref:class F sortase n=1 Tax=Patulibacter sp. NPDC049589 TaxID=3154731 RepID=UPI0034383159